MIREAQKRKAALWQPSGIGVVVVRLELTLRFSISIMPALPANWLMHYSTHPTHRQAGIELHHNEKQPVSQHERRISCHIVKLLICCAETKSPNRLRSGLSIGDASAQCRYLAFNQCGLICAVYLFPHYHRAQFALLPEHNCI